MLHTLGFRVADEIMSERVERRTDKNVGLGKFARLKMIIFRYSTRGESGRKPLADDIIVVSTRDQLQWSSFESEPFNKPVWAANIITVRGRRLREILSVRKSIAWYRNEHNKYRKYKYRSDLFAEPSGGYSGPLQFGRYNKMIFMRSVIIYSLRYGVLLTENTTNVRER